MGVVEVLDPVQTARAGGGSVDVSRGERNGRVSSEWFNRPDDERNEELAMHAVRHGVSHGSIAAFVTFVSA